MKEKDDDIVVVAPVIRSELFLMFSMPGTVAAECSTCEVMVALSPNGQQFMRERKARVICDECAHSLPRDDVKFEGSVPGTLEELHRHGFYMDIETEDELVEELRRRRWQS